MWFCLDNNADDDGNFDKSIGICLAFDAAWQKRGSGRAFSSVTGMAYSIAVANSST